MKTNIESNTAFYLQILIIIFAAIACVGGLFIDNLYRDSDFYKTAWFGNDCITLVLVIPMLILSLAYSQRGSLRAKLISAGLIAYMFYNYAFYLFGAAFNSFFLLYVALFAISMYTLIILLSNMDTEFIAKSFDTGTPVKMISIYLIVMVLPLAIFEISQCVRFIMTNHLPEAPSLIFALDLSLVIPASVLAAVLLWKKQSWGYILAVIMLVKGFAYSTVLSFSTALIAGFSSSGNWDPLMPYYLFVAVGSLICGIILIKNIKQSNSSI